jgi:hypothetical protein
VRRDSRKGLQTRDFRYLNRLSDNRCIINPAPGVIRRNRRYDGPIGSIIDASLRHAAAVDASVREAVFGVARPIIQPQSIAMVNGVAA